MKHFPLALIISFGLVACSAPSDPNSPFALSDGSTASASSESSAASVASLLEIGKTFTDEKAGYSIILPKTVAVGKPNCNPVEGSPPQEYYQITYEQAEVVAIQDGTKTYFTPAYEYNQDCTKKMHNSAYLKEQMGDYPERGVVWLLETKTIRNDAELDAFIKQWYGKDCSLGEKIPTLQEGTFDISIDGFGPPEGDYDCFVNYITVMKYSPTLKKLVRWDMGQDYTFRPDGEGSYDMDIARSFRFE